jgi:hypothetical protein
MKLVVLAFVLAFAGCGGDDTELPTPFADAALACNPVAQTGCSTGEKCTWLVDIDSTPTTPQIGHVGCARDGATADGAACSDPSSGGADDCIAGDVCILGTCKPICDPQLVGGATGACPTSYACSIYADVFESAGNSIAGVCEPTCSPLTQTLNVGANTAACGSPDPAQPVSTCVASAAFRSFHCAPTSSELYANVDRKPPFTDAGGNVYTNGCAPGFIPFYYEDASGAMQTLCTGMCAPLKVDQTIAAEAAHKDDSRGDKMALGKLPTELAPALGKATCDAGIKGSTVTAPRGQDCRFLWFPLAKGDPTKALDSPFNDTLGVCFAYEKFLTVTVPGMTQKQPEKSCAELPAVAPTDDPYGSAKDNGCYPLAESLGSPPAARRAPSYRLANGAGTAVRHIFK